MGLRVRRKKSESRIEEIYPRSEGILEYWNLILLEF
jgi:hypothetical protein